MFYFRFIFHRRQYSVLAISYFSLAAKLLEKATRVHVKSAAKSTSRIAFPKEVAIFHFI